MGERVQCSCQLLTIRFAQRRTHAAVDDPVQFFQTTSTRRRGIFFFMADSVTHEFRCERITQLLFDRAIWAFAVGGLAPSQSTPGEARWSPAIRLP